MSDEKKLSIKEIVKELDIESIYIPDDVDYYIKTSDVNRPGLQLAGYQKHFPYERIQVLGMVEYTYFMELSLEERVKRLDSYMSNNIPALILARDQKPTEEIIDYAKKYKRILLTTKLPTTRFINKLASYVNSQLAPSMVIHGVVVDVDGIGVLIQGKSGVGKSETALELIKRGHRLVADDSVEVKLLEDDTIVAQAPKLTRYYMEIRGIGILDIRSLYGVGAIRPSKDIDMIIQLENWNEDKVYDRLGMDVEYANILGVNIEKTTIPIKPGRNLAIIIEIAARNYRQKYMGYNAAKSFNEKLSRHLQSR
ncbi:MAG: HPr(Ser) kinase/phosphatase [Filifactoraceae bacterium]